MIGAPAALAAEIVAARQERRVIAPFTARDSGFDLAAAHVVAGELKRIRVAAGEVQIGRKIGFTNRNIWAEYGVFAPIWGEVYDSTAVDVKPGSRLSIGHLSQPRLEPEIVLGVDRDLEPGMRLQDIEQSVAWVAHGFEIVQTVFPDWKFKLADCAAEGGLHGALAIGPRKVLAKDERDGLADRLSAIRIDLLRDGEPVDSGVGANVLDGPVHALKHLVDALGATPGSVPVRKGELITTGTITRAFPIAPGETWETRLAGFDLPGMRLSFA